MKNVHLMIISGGRKMVFSFSYIFYFSTFLQYIPIAIVIKGYF